MASLLEVVDKGQRLCAQDQVGVLHSRAANYRQQRRRFGDEADVRQEVFLGLVVVLV
jgi:hypothetical protein